MTRALLDLEAGVSILSGSLYDQYDFGPLRKADTTVVLADLTLKLPRGIVTDVIVMIEDFYYPVDFLVLDYVTVDPKWQPNVILGRLFLATANALINCRPGVVDMAFGTKNLRLNVFSNVSNPLVNDECFAAEVIDGLNPHESEDDATEDCAICYRKQVERLPDTINSKLKPSLESPPAVELKELPKHLKYVFLGEGETLPAIIAANLEDEQEKALVEVLKEHKAAIGWTIADLRGISPSIFMHKIITDPEAKPAHDAQRRLNPNMREVVKKEVLKWLDADIIFSISDSTWVSPTQTVPKKAGIQITHNEKGEEIATGPVTGWWICVDYRKLNAATSKDHFPLPFIDQIIKKLAGQKFYCFLDGCSGYNQIAIHPDDQHKTTFTCPYGTFAFSDYVVGAVLGQRVDKKPVAIYYASKTLYDAQINYTTTEKELLAVVYALDRFRYYIWMSKVIAFSDHSAVKYLMEKKDAKLRLIRWILLLQEFDVEICDKKGSENVVADHLSRLVGQEEEEEDERAINESFPDEQLFSIQFRNLGQRRRSSTFSRRPDRKDWSNKLNDALWAYRTAYKTPIGTTPYRLVYRKGCHLPVELVHRALWAVKNINLDYECAASGRDPYQVKRVGKFGEVEIEDFDDHLRQVVNGHRLKPYLEDADLNEEIHESEVCFLAGEPTYSFD
ncbi:uncharacterized protein LOC143634196 [Bidens hawaiensis]|uniref:uncharacterized protein LOC143634196 n=1 Tax=Bidens hawaiensis TaxID=980011 RepID=UPI0040490EEA